MELEVQLSISETKLPGLSQSYFLNLTVSYEGCAVLSCFSLLLFATPWTVAHQAPLSTGFFRQEHWGGLPFPSPGDLPDPGIKSLTSPTLAGGFFTSSATWEAL